MIRHFAIASLALCACTTAALAAEAEDATMGRRVQDLLHAHQAEVFGCVAQAKGTVRGEMLIRVLVGADQHPQKADVLKDQTGVPALGPCLQAQIQKWDLSSLKANTGDQIVFPLAFQPEPLKPGEKRSLVPMSAQETHGSQRFLVDDQSIGEAPLASMELLTLQSNQSAPAKPRKDDEEELVLYVLDGSFKVAGTVVGPGDAVWIGAHTDKPAIAPENKKTVKILEIRAHGEGTGQKVVKGADAKDYDLPGGKGKVKLLLDGTGAKLAVDEIDADQGATVTSHKHASQDELIFFVSGNSETTVGKQTFATAPGDALRIAANAPHSLKVSEKLHAIQVYAPGGPEQRFKGGGAEEKPSKKKKGK
jgi:quercetin dioxygenase-like cupin family protein